MQNVKGQCFEAAKENIEILTEAERMKAKHLMNALAQIIQEFPDFSTIIEGPLAENGIKIPSRPATPSDRPSTGASQRSNGSRR